MKSTWMLALAVVLAAGTSFAKFSRTAAINGSTPVGMTLQGNTVYEVRDGMTLTAGPGASALYVAPNAITAIHILKGRTLTLSGGDGWERSPGAPAILVPASSTLVIMGEGKLVATGGCAGGGKSGHGGNGGSFKLNHDEVFGKEISIDDSSAEFTVGDGGNGGNGGGGAAPAIGGGGGTGGAGGSGASGYFYYWTDFSSEVGFCRDGSAGGGGGGGTSGSSCGRVIVLGSVEVVAKGGAAGPSAGGWGYFGPAAQSSSKDVKSLLYYNRYAACGSGGGGGGGNGYGARYGIGGGAPGAGGGGGGGSGARFLNRNPKNDVTNLHGGCGRGGQGSPDGGTGPDRVWGRVLKIGAEFCGGSQGAAGGAGQFGGDGTLLKSAASRLDCGRTPSGSAETIPELTYNAYFDPAGGTGDYTKSVSYAYSTGFKATVPSIKGLPSSEGRIFIGYYSQPNGGGDMYVDANGSWVRDVALLKDLPLYAKYGSAGMCTVTFAKGNGSGGENTRELEAGLRKLDPTPPPTQAGFLFGGYFTGADGTGTQVFSADGKCIGGWVTTLGAPVLYAYWIPSTKVNTSASTGATLTNGEVYRLSGNKQNGNASGCGLIVPTYSTVYLCVDAGSTLTCKGGNASGRNHAGAGIYVPSTSTLYVFGGGTLNATGGNAAGGSAGGRGKNGTVATEWQYGGSGGTGGAGGGGAGAGIGGIGGDGGNTKTIPDRYMYNGWEYLAENFGEMMLRGNYGYASGMIGPTGNSGGAGAGGGALVVCGSVAVTGTGGAASTSPGTGGACGSDEQSKERGAKLGDPFVANTSGGGGGGGGGAGGGALGLGGGGGGGGSGGVGGGGGAIGTHPTMDRTISLSSCVVGGGGGLGGKGGVGGGSDGAQGASRKGDGQPDKVDTGKRNFQPGVGDVPVYASGGDCGPAGAAGTRPDTGTLKRTTEAASVQGGSKEPTLDADAVPEVLRPVMTFDGCGATDQGTESQVVELQYGLGAKGEPIVPPTREGCDFGGYYTEQYGFGTGHVDANGVWTNGYSTVGTARRLYARWTTTVTLEMNKPGGTFTGGGVCTIGILTTFGVTPKTGWIFQGWSDGMEESTREILVEDPVTYTALFEPDYDSDWWKGYDKSAGVAFHTDDEAVVGGYAVRGGRVYYKTLADALRDAPDGVRLELLKNVEEAGPFAFGSAKTRILDGCSFQIDMTVGSFDVPAGTSLVLSNATVSGGVSVEVDADIALDGACVVDELELRRNIRIRVLGDLAGSSIGIRAEDDELTAGFNAQNAALFHHLDGAGVGVNKAGEAEIGWYTGTGTKEDPYGVIAAVFDASISNILEDVVIGPSTAYLKMPVAGLVSATEDIAFTMPAKRSLVFVLQGDFAAGTHAIFGPMDGTIDLSAFSLSGTAAGKLYTLETNAQNVVMLKVVDPSARIEVPADDSWMLNGFSGDDNLIKLGEGELVLEGTSAHTGYTIVSNGTLTLLGTIPNSNPVTVEKDATLALGPDAAIAKALVVTNGATLLVTAGATLTNEVTFTGGAILRFAGEGTITTADGGANVTFGQKVVVTLDAAFPNGKHTLIDALPAGVDGVDAWFTLDGRDDTKYYQLVVEDGKLVVEVSTEPFETKANMKDATGAPVSLKIDVDPDWMTTNLTTYVNPESDEATVNHELNVRAQNGMTYWQNYVLNTTPDDPESKGFVLRDVEESKKTNPTNVYVEAVSVPLRTGVPVELAYRLDKVNADGETVVTGRLDKSTVIALPVDAVADPTGIYTVRGQFVKTNDVTVTSDETIEDGKLFGVIRVTETNRFQAIATPFLDLAKTEDVGTTVSNLIQTATLTPGDKLYMYGDDGAYKVFELNAQRVWTAQPVVQVKMAAAGPQLAAAPKLAAAEPAVGADAVVTERGKGAYLERQDPTKPFALVGRYAAMSPDVAVEKGSAKQPGYTLLGAPSVTAYDLSCVAGAGEGDQIIVPGDVPKVFTQEGDQWGYWKTVEQTVTIGGQEVKAVKSVWTTDESKIAPGTGFIFVNKSGNDVRVE